MVWEPERDDREWSDREAWRGDLHADDVDQWRGDGDGAWVWIEDEEDSSRPDAGWPEDQAGPEYWLFKRDCDP
jgi:hypothetical protein